MRYEGDENQNEVHDDMLDEVVDEVNEEIRTIQTERKVITVDLDKVPCDPPNACEEHGRCWPHSVWADGDGADAQVREGVEFFGAEPPLHLPQATAYTLWMLGDEGDTKICTRATQQEVEDYMLDLVATSGGQLMASDFFVKESDSAAQRLWDADHERQDAVQRTIMVEAAKNLARMIENYGPVGDLFTRMDPHFLSILTETFEGEFDDEIY